MIILLLLYQDLLNTGAMFCNEQKKKTNSPITDFLSLPKAQMQQRLPGTVNFVKLHRELKYLGRMPRAFARLEYYNIIVCACVDGWE